MSGHMPGFGDSATWPAYCGAHGDPRDDDTSEIDKHLDLIDEIEEQLVQARSHLCRRDEDAFKLAILNAHDLAGSLFQ